jgi:plastocyanin
VRAAAAALIVAAALAGCGGGDSEEPKVDAADFSFDPGTTEVKVGQTVEWTNTGSTDHTVKGPGFFSKAIEPGGTYSRRFLEAGSFKYICTLHPDAMRATVVVSD